MWRATCRKVSHQACAKDFNPRPPWGGRRFGASSRRISTSNFNPRPPWGGRPGSLRIYYRDSSNFNPRPPWGGRRNLPPTSSAGRPFQSTPSVGRATLTLFIIPDGTKISIHALRGEGDITSKLNKQSIQTFQSTPSVGRATDKSRFPINLNSSFQSTPSVGRATAHRPPKTPAARHFNPRPPWGGRRHIRHIPAHRSPLFQSTPSVGRATISKCY